MSVRGPAGRCMGREKSAVCPSAGVLDRMRVYYSSTNIQSLKIGRKKGSTFGVPSDQYLRFDMERGGVISPVVRNRNVVSNSPSTLQSQPKSPRGCRRPEKGMEMKTEMTIESS